VRVVVADNGQGIAPAFLPQIFDRFSQGDSTVTRAHGGLGLGMSIVRHLVELHGGTVQAESEGENRGATLTVTLPIRVYHEPTERPLPTPRQEAEAEVPWAELPQLDGISVLVVDDELNARQVAAAILQEKGAAVAEAGSAEEALDLAAGGRVDLIISDIAMPVIDGYEMMRRLRQRSGRFVPAVALTAAVAPEDVAAALSAGYQKHLPKPVSAAALVRTVAELAPCRTLAETPDRGPAPSTEPSDAAARPPSGSEV
jgi:CheY-like chemotaxis protein